MKVNELAKYLASLKPELQDKQVKVLAENGEIMICEPKIILKESNFQITNENVDFIYLTV